jgi:hypothetical protein
MLKNATKCVCGGVELKVRHYDLQDPDHCDTLFFEPGYTMAAATGMAKVWDGAWALIALMQDPNSRIGAAASRGRARLHVHMYTRSFSCTQHSQLPLLHTHI